RAKMAQLLLHPPAVPEIAAAIYGHCGFIAVVQSCEDAGNDASPADTAHRCAAAINLRKASDQCMSPYSIHYGMIEPLLLQCHTDFKIGCPAIRLLESARQGFPVFSIAP